MNWRWLRLVPWLDSRARFVAKVPTGGTLLDLGSSDGETLRHMAELRPDLALRSIDIAGHPESYPPQTEFAQLNLEEEEFPWPAKSVDAVTCMHLVEHLRGLDNLLAQTARVLKPGGRAYFETPGPRSLELPRAAEMGAANFTLNFYDDLTHVRLVEIGALAAQAEAHGLKTIAQGISRNLLFAMAWPWFWFAPPSRKKFTSYVHWLGWSAYLVVERKS